MPSWNELVNALEAQKTDAEKTKWLFGNLRALSNKLGS